MIRRFATSALALVLASSAAAQEAAEAEGGPWNDDEIPCVTEGAFPFAELDSWGIEPGRSTLSQVQAKLGESKVFAMKMGWSAQAVCYVLANEQAIVFESSLMAPDDGVLTQITVAATRFVPFMSDCSPIEMNEATKRAPKGSVGTVRATFERSISVSACARGPNLTDWWFEASGEWRTLTGMRARFEGMYSTKRVLPQPVGPLSRTGSFWRKAASKTSTSSASGR